MKEKPQSSSFGMLAPLRIRSFRSLFCSSTLWWFAMWSEFIAVGWIALELTDSPFSVALVKFFRMSPLILTGLFSGVLIDRFGRRRVIIAAQGLHFLVVASMAFLFGSGQGEYWHLVAGAFFLGIVFSVDYPSRRSLIPDLVGKKMTSDAVICDGIGSNISRVLGPLTGGLSLQYLGPPGCFLILCVFSLSSLFFLLQLPTGPITRDAMPSAESPLAQLKEGFNYAREHQVILAILGITMTMCFFGFPYHTLLPVFARDILHQDAAGLGFIGMAAGLGAFPGIWIVYRLKTKIPEGLIYSVGTLCFALTIVFFATSSSFPLSFSILFFGGIGFSCFSLMQTTLILASSSDEMRNRAMGLLVLAIGISPLGELQMGALASRFGAPFALQLSASLAVLSILLIMLLFPKIRGAGGVEEWKIAEEDR